jgi:hypothetical protein
VNMEREQEYDVKTTEQWKGAVRVEEIKAYYQSLGYKVTIYPINDHHHIDLIAENDYEVIALEVTNWNNTHSFNMEKLEGWLRHWDIVENEMKFRNDKRKLIKRLVYNYPRNIEFILDYLLRYRVGLQYMGAQNTSDSSIKRPRGNE